MSDHLSQRWPAPAARAAKEVDQLRAAERARAQGGPPQLQPASFRASSERLAPLVRQLCIDSIERRL